MRNSDIFLIAISLITLSLIAVYKLGNRCVYCKGKLELDKEKAEMGYGFDMYCTRCGQKQPKGVHRI